MNEQSIGGEQALKDEAKKLVKRAHDIEDSMHSYATGCTGEEMDALRQELISVTVKLDEIKDKMGEKIQEEY